jgi:hypothetical protein
MRQEFERHRYVNKLPVVDVLIMQNNAEYQASNSFSAMLAGCHHRNMEILFDMEASCAEARRLIPYIT